MDVEIKLGHAQIDVNGNAPEVATETQKFYAGVQAIAQIHVSGNAAGSMPSVAPAPPAPIITPVVAPVVPAAPVMPAAAAPSTGNGGDGSSPAPSS
jgi:hypothetical protein